jgi:hypothetical protein
MVDLLEDLVSVTSWTPSLAVGDRAARALACDAAKML